MSNLYMRSCWHEAAQGEILNQRCGWVEAVEYTNSKQKLSARIAHQLSGGISQQQFSTPGRQPIAKSIPTHRDVAKAVQRMGMCLRALTNIQQQKAFRNLVDNTTEFNGAGRANVL